MARNSVRTGSLPMSWYYLHGLSPCVKHGLVIVLRTFMRLRFYIYIVFAIARFYTPLRSRGCDRLILYLVYIFACSTYVREGPRYVGEDPALHLCRVRERADVKFASKPTHPLVSSQYSSPLWHNTICRSPVIYHQLTGQLTPATRPFKTQNTKQ